MVAVVHPIGGGRRDFRHRRFGGCNGQKHLIATGRIAGVLHFKGEFAGCGWDDHIAQTDAIGVGCRTLADDVPIQIPGRRQVFRGVIWIAHHPPKTLGIALQDFGPVRMGRDFSLRLGVEGFHTLIARTSEQRHRNQQVNRTRHGALRDEAEDNTSSPVTGPYFRVIPSS